MKVIIFIFLTLSLSVFISCNQTVSNVAKPEIIMDQRKPITTIEETKKYIVEQFKNQEEYLWVSKSLNDDSGFNMAIIVDVALKSGYMPNGFNQMEDYRIYKYKKF